MITPQIFAAMLATAMKFREDSWTARPTKIKPSPGVLFSLTSPGFHAKSYEQAALEAVRFHQQDERWAHPVEFLMIGAWNDAADWARSLI